MLIRKFDRGSLPLPRAPLSFEKLPGGLEIEIGCGTGLHPESLARRHPDRTVIAIEHTHERFGKFERRLASQTDRPSNLIAIHANAISWIAHAVAPASVDRYHLLYPNPYPRTRDRGRRWHWMPFFAVLRETLKPGGELVLATNLDWYAREAAGAITGAWGLELVEESTLVSGRQLPRTAFEKKYLERGETCWNLRFRRPSP